MSVHSDGHGGPKHNAVGEAMLLGLEAAQGNADTQSYLAAMLDERHGGPKDEAEARRLHGLAAAQGLADAQFRLAGMLDTCL